MKKLILMLVLLASILQSSFAQFTRLNTSDLSSIEGYISSQMTAEQMVGLSVGIIKNGEVAHLKGYGVIDLNTNEPATENSMYRLASVSKSVTAVLALQLMEENSLDLNEDIRTYVPEYPSKPQGIITSEDLLSNESGIIHYSGTDEDQYCNESYNSTARDNYIATHTNYYDPVAAIDIFKDQQICFQPGAHHQYTTWGFCLMAAVIERASPKTYEELLEDNIVCPLNLPSLQIEFQDSRPYPNEVTGYEISGGSVQPSSPSIDLTDISYKVGGGGLIGSVTDLTLFIQGIVNADLFTDGTKDLMGTINIPDDGQTGNYGYGTYSGHRDGNRLYNHGGAQSKTATLIYYSPDNKNGVALMCNTKNVSLYPLARLIYDHLSGTNINTSPEFTIDDCQVISCGSSGSPVVQSLGLETTQKLSRFLSTEMKQNLKNIQSLYIQHQDEINQVFVSNYKKNTRISSLQKELKPQIIEMLRNAFIDDSNPVITNDHIQLFNDFLFELKILVKDESLKNNIEKVRNFLCVMENKSVHQALKALDKAKVKDCKYQQKNIMKSNFASFELRQSSNKNMTLGFDVSTTGNIQIQLLDINGRLMNMIANRNVDQESQNQEHFNTRNLSPGIYFITAIYNHQNGQEYFYEKIVVGSN